MQSDNPKDRVSQTKVPVDLWPASATVSGAMGLYVGYLKYGMVNWRATPVSARVYIGAMLRHLLDYMDGEDLDDGEDGSGLPQLSMILANAAILVDAGYAGTLVDDRVLPGGARDALEAMRPHVMRLHAMYGERKPHHYTVADREFVAQVRAEKECCSSDPT